jgi:hypothetical protein
MNNNKDVYLAGPISGLNFGECTDWRDTVRLQLSMAGIRGLSPLRAKEYLAALGDAKLTGTGEEYRDLGLMSTPRAVMTRDRFDASRCGVLFVNLLGATKVSIGTMMEVAWADLNRTPIVCVIEPTGNVHEHMMLTEAIGFRVATIEDGIKVTKAILA